MNITVVIAAAVLIEGLVEYGKTISDMFAGGEKKAGITQIVTIIVGILIAYAFNADMFVPLGFTVNHYVGVALTGIIMSRGSNYVNDIITKIRQKTVG